VDLGEPSWFARDSKFISVLSAHVDSPLGPQVLDLFQAMMRWQGGAGRRWALLLSSLLGSAAGHGSLAGSAAALTAFTAAPGLEMAIMRHHVIDAPVPLVCISNCTGSICRVAF
jgi:hypothetical protein